MTTQIRLAVAADAPALQALMGAAPTGPTAAAWPAAAQHLVATDAQGQALASVRLQPPIGLVRPRYWYRVGCAVHAAADLHLFRRQTTLQLGNDLTGACELTDLAMASGAASDLAALVAAARAIAGGHPATQQCPVIAELRGRRDALGRSPFWWGLGRHFYAGNPDEVRALHGSDASGHLAMLLPRQLLYADFLPADAQAALGMARAEAEPTRQALQASGGRFGGHVAIDDGGPVLAWAGA